MGAASAAAGALAPSGAGALAPSGLAAWAPAAASDGAAGPSGFSTSGGSSASGDAIATAAPSRAADGLDPRDALRLRTQFKREVRRRLTVPPGEQRNYAARLQDELAERGLGDLERQYVVLVDRNPNVQAVFIYFRGASTERWRMIGASPVSTGLPGRYDHFVTPLGVFEHTPQNMDFRAEGTLNENGIRGYGARDMRIFDFGWTDGERGWGKGGMSQMRFQMHATDPDKLEWLLGTRHSKGCVRIPGSLNRFFDYHGILDADYEALADAGNPVPALHPGRSVTPWAGRYLVVIDSGITRRPAWSPPPRGIARTRVSAEASTAD
ncbi:MAG TPA: L,D-transpeptidase [Trinickia sp.]|jgi:hypothetical protein|nr:L,D-transpeptidase [Trinickia sp.]